MHCGSINHGVHVTGLRRHLWGSSMSGSSCVFEISEKINYMKEPWCPCTCNSLVNHRSGEYLECLVYPINYWSRIYVTVTWLRLVTRPPYWQKGKTNATPIADARTSWFYFYAKPSDLFFSVDVFQINCWYIVFTQVFAMSYQCIERLWGDALSRYRTKIQLTGPDSCPDQYPVIRGSTTRRKWPNVQYPDGYE